MRRPNAGLAVVLSTVALLSGCGPGSTNDGAAPATQAQSTPSSAEATQAPAPTVATPVAVPVKPTTTPAVTELKPPAAGSALAAVTRLTVKGRAPKTGYTRDQFGQSWYDTDRNGCDTRTICSDQVEQVAA